MPRLTKQQREDVVKKYADGYSCPIIAKEFGIHVTSVWSLLKTRKIACRPQSEAQKKHTLDETVFDNLNPASCYWAGFLMADGCLYNRPTRTQGKSLTIKLAEVDLNHIIKFKQFLTSSHKITEVRQTLNSKEFLSYQVSITNAYLVNSLLSIGFNYDGKLNLPLESWQTLDFWRGVIDGDGSIGFNDGYPKIELVGHTPIVSLFEKFVLSLYPNIKARTRKHKSIIAFGTCGGNAGQLIKLLYKDSLVYLDRKFKIASAFF